MHARTISLIIFKAMLISLRNFRLCIRVKCDRDAVNNHLVSACVKVFLEKKESLLLRFCDEFKKLTLADEKQDLVDSFLSKLNAKIDNDSIWQCE